MSLENKIQLLEEQLQLLKDQCELQQKYIALLELNQKPIPGPRRLMSEDEIKQIRSMSESGMRSCDIAREMNRNKTTISLIVRKLPPYD